jgi:hypothetical protein
MRRVIATFFALAASATVAAAGVAASLDLPSGPLAGGLFFLSAAMGLVSVALAGRILFVLEHRRTTVGSTGPNR